MPKSIDSPEQREILPPINGLDRSSKWSAQPRGTTQDLLNVRDLPPLSDRRQIGKRWGSTRAWAEAAGFEPFAHTITAVTSTTFTFAGDDSILGRFTPGTPFRVSGNATSAANVQYVVTAISLSGASLTVTVASTNSATVSGSIKLLRKVTHLQPVVRATTGPSAEGGQFESADDAFPATTGTNGYGVGTSATVPDFDGNYVQFTKPLTTIDVLGAVADGMARITGGLTAVNSSTQGLDLYGPDNSVGGVIRQNGVAVNYATNNDVTVTLEAVATAANPTVTGSPNDEPTYVGPFIRGGNVLGTCIVAYLEQVAGTANRVRLVIDQRSSTSVTRLASGTNKDLSGAGTSRDLTIQLKATEDGITASVSWPTEGSYTDTLRLPSNTTYASQNRGGVMVVCVDSAAPATMAWRRRVRRLQYQRWVPNTPTVIATMSGRSTFTGAGRYVVPRGWTAVNITDLSPGPATATAQDGPYSSNSDPAFPAADTTQVVGTVTGVLVGAVDPGSVCQLLRRTQTAEVRYSVEMRFLDITSNQDMIGFVTRLSSDHLDFIRVRFVRNISTQSGAGDYSWLDSIIVETITDGAIAATTTRTYGAGSGNAAPLFSIDQWLRFTDDGASVNVFVNGMNVFHHAITTHASNLDVGVDIQGTSGTHYANEFRITYSPTAALLASDQGRVDVVVFSRDAIDVGKIGGSDLLPCSGTGGLLNPLPSSCVIAGSVYAVDGDRERIINPATLAVTTFAASLGTVTAKPELVCNYRGRLVRARFRTNRRLWEMSRVLAPTDFDFSATSSTATKAYTGANADVGMPADDITALIPFSDDYLYFGCASSMWMLEGDPGAGGLVVPVSYKSGVLGPRCWCFDDKKRMYFMGSGGLYVLLPGTTEPLQLSGKKLYRVLEEVNPITNLIQMAFDAFKREVRIWITPLDGSLGRHVAYSLPSDELEGAGRFWLDEYQSTHGPYAVCEIPGLQDEQRQWLIGGSDGYVRQPTDSAKADDGASISAFFRSAPIEMAVGGGDTLMLELQAEGVTGSGEVNWYLFAADTPELVAAMDPVDAVASGTWFAGGDTGFQEPVGIRQSAGALQLYVRQISSTDTFAIERIRCVVQLVRRRRL